jgi:hypothetical protein
MSPEQAGAAAAAPYDAVASVAGTVAQTTADIGEKYRQQRAKTAVVDAETQTTMMAAALENLPKEAAKNGWNSQQLAEAGQATLQTFDDSLNAIDPEFREEFRPAWQKNKAMYAQEIANMAVQYEDIQNRQKVEASWIAANAADDPIRMKMVRDMKEQLNYSDPAELAEMDAKIDVAIKEQAVDEIYETWRTSDNKDKLYEQLVNNESIDADVKSNAIKRIEGQINNEKTLDVQRTRQAAIMYERKVTDLRLAARNGADITSQIEPLIAEIDAFNSPALSNKASEWRNQLYMETVKGQEKKVDYTMMGRNLAVGPGSMVNDKSNRTTLQGYVETIIPPDATNEERILIENNITKVAGFPPQNVQQQMKAGGSGFNSAPLVRAAIRYIEITDGDAYTGVDFGLTETETANIASVARAIKDGSDYQAVAEGIVENNKLWRDDKQVTSALQKQSNGIETEEAFDKLFDNSYDDLGWWAGGQAEATTPEEAQARIRYRDYVQEAYIRNGGDEEGAILAADIRFQQNHAMTYINGEPELQYGGIRAGSKELGDTLFESDLKGMTLIGLDETESYVITIKDRDDVKFRNPQIINGQQHYQVYVNDRPAFSSDENNRRKSVYVVVDEDAELALQDASDAEQIKDIRTKISKLQSEMRRIERSGTDRTDYDTLTVTKDTRAREQDIPKEIELLQRQIRNLQ